MHFVNGSSGLLREKNLEVYSTMLKNKQTVLSQLAAILKKLDGTTLRRDVAARAEFAKDCLQNRCLQKLKCCAWCVGDGWGDFYALHYADIELLSPADHAAERTLRFKEFFLSGLCHACQRSVFN